MGVKTRAMTLAQAEAARRTRKAASSPSWNQTTYVQLRSRGLVVTSSPRISRSGGKSSRSSRFLKADPSEISRVEINASCELLEVGDDSESVRCSHSPSRERETAPSSNQNEDPSADLDSTAGFRSATQRSTVAITPSGAEVEEFFAAAERRIMRQFATRYNFDVANDVPLEGRYEWTKVGLDD